MEFCPRSGKYYQPNMPFSSNAMPIRSMRMNAPPVLPTMNYLLNQGITMPPRPPRLPASPLNTLLGDMNSTSYSRFSPQFNDEQRFRRRRVIRIHAPNPAWTANQLTTQSLLSTSNISQPTSRILSITKVDSTGGCTVVTRRRQDGHLDVRVVYSREFIINASASPFALFPPPNFRQMVLEMMEIVATFPKSYYNTIRQNAGSGGSR